MRSGHRTGFARVIYEITLTIFTGIFSNNLNRVFVSTNRTVSTQAEEYSTDNIFRFGVDRIVERQRGVVDIVINTNGEAVNRFSCSGIVINSFNHARSEFFRRQAVTSAENFRHIGDFAVCKSLSQSGNNVQIQRFAGRAGFFSSVEDGNNFN